MQFDSIEPLNPVGVILRGLFEGGGKSTAVPTSSGPNWKSQMQVMKMVTKLQEIRNLKKRKR